MARIRGFDALDEEFGDDVYYDHGCVEELFAPTKGKGSDTFCMKWCDCGHQNHIAKKKCDNCGVEKIEKKVDWQLIKEKAPKCPYYSTKCMFKRACQLHARHHRDIVVMIHHRSNKKDVFRFWGTPGSGEEFFEGKLGNAIKDAWLCQFVQPRRPGKRSSSSSDSPPRKKTKSSSDGSCSEDRESNSCDDNMSDLTDSPAKAVESVEPATNTELDVEVGEGDIEKAFKVQSVLKKRVKNGGIEYLVQWEGYSSCFNSWEPASHIIDPKLVEKFV